MKNKREKLKIIPLGGCFEIGMNLMAFETKKEIVIVDSGIGFSENNNFGVDILISDYTYLEKRIDKIKALFITHGHEDHIGAITNILRLKNVPVYATAFPAELIESKCVEEEIDLDIVVVDQFKQYDVGEFSITFFPVEHSIVETSGLKICVHGYTITYISDFKVERHKKRYAKIFKELGLIKSDLLFLDSTNVNVMGWCQEEGSIVKELTNIVNEASGKVFFTTFASNIKRIQIAINIAKMVKRKVFFVGRSMHTYSKIAKKMNYLEFDETDIDLIENVASYSDDKVFVLATGSQGENRSIMKRLSMNEMKRIKLKSDDRVIFSSKIIPGNERTIRTLINDISRLKSEVFTEEAHKIHVSGHAKRDELEFVMKAIKPKNFVPVHGEYRFLCDHVELAKKCGVSDENAKVVENGQELFLTPEGIKYGKLHDFKPVALDFINRDLISNEVLRERKKIARIGIIFVVLHICKKKKGLKEEPRIVSKGFSPGGMGNYLLDELKICVGEKVHEFFHSKDKSRLGNINNIEEYINIQVKRFIDRDLGFRPIVVSEIVFS